MDNDTRTRLFEEHGELRQRISKLEKFIPTSKFEALPRYDQDDLRDQLAHMRAYWSVLSRCVSRQM
jgi:NTP pyrophosphatase (non-canonical NTP hydrolase)